MNPVWEQHKKKIILGFITAFLVLFCCCCNWERWGS